MKTTTRWGRLASRTAMVAVLVLAAQDDAAGQRTSSAPVAATTPVAATAQTCTGAKVGSLGLMGWDCRGDCTLTLDEKNGEKAWSFSVEPRIVGIEPGSPADGVLQAGDILVAVDGLLITTKEGGERMANLPADADVVVRFRRGGRMAEATIHTAAACRTSWELPPVPGVPGELPPVAGVPGVPPPPPAPDVAGPRVVSPRIRTTGRARVGPAPTGVVIAPPSLWAPGHEEAPTRPRLGVGFTCTECGTRSDSVTGDESWFFTHPPEVTAVDSGSAADRAGIQIGDRILALDGIGITTEAGGRVFTAVRPGVAVRVTLAKRSGREQTVTVVPESAPRRERAAVPTPARAPRPAAAPAPAAPPPPPEASLSPGDFPVRYSGTLAGVEVEVRGEPVMVSSDATGTRTIIIRSDGLWIRIRVPATGGR